MASAPAPAPPSDTISAAPFSEAQAEAAQAQSESSEASACHAQFRNAYLIHGVKHVCDNALKDIMPRMSLRLAQTD